MSISMTQSYIERRSLDLIFLAPHHESGPEVPSWSPDYFCFDECPPQRRLYDVALRHRARDGLGHTFAQGRTMHSTLTPKRQNGWEPRLFEGDTMTTWSATGDTRTMVTFTGSILGTSARRIRSIRSLGQAWSDPDGSVFPQHDKRWSRMCGPVDIKKMVRDAFIHEEYKYNEPVGNIYRRSGRSWASIEFYLYTHIFLQSHGKCDLESPETDSFATWLCANRAFFVGRKSLQEHAKALRHPFFHCGTAAWNPLPITLWRDQLLKPLEQMAAQNMRLMCLDDASFGIGWAALGARLEDEIFLIPGCSSPVIFGRTRSATAGSITSW
jgi:hypothetical protein